MIKKITRHLLFKNKYLDFICWYVFFLVIFVSALFLLFMLFRFEFFHCVVSLIFTNLLQQLIDSVRFKLRTDGVLSETGCHYAKVLQ